MVLSRSQKIRVGRGEAAETGEGKGRGTKGQGARAGRGTTFAFEGGQTPLTKMYPKKGFFNLYVLFRLQGDILFGVEGVSRDGL